MSAGRLIRGAAATLTLLLAACGVDRPADPVAEAPLAFEVAAGADAMRHGERLSRVLGCQGCHGADLQGQPWDEEPAIAISFSSNLTRAVPAYSDAALERAIRHGVRIDGSPLWGMPSELFAHLDGADMAALLAWLRMLRPAGTVHPRIRFGPQGRREVEQGEYRPAPRLVREARAIATPRLDGRHDWARYMVRATCAECHGLDLGGRDRTPDLHVAGGYTRAGFRQLMRTGEGNARRDLGLMGQVARGRFAHLTDREIDAVYDYLVARANAAR